MTRSADTVFRRSFEAPFAFDEISERGALKLTSVLRVTAPRHFELWLDEIGGRDFFEATGLFIPIVAFDLYVTDHPIRLGEPFEVNVEIRLARQLGDNGSTRRLISESLAEVYSKHATTGERVLIARNLKHNALSRNDPDPAMRRVTELHPSMNLGKSPERVGSFPTVDELAIPPRDHAQVAHFEEVEPHFWSYQQTDMNEHIHAMEYVRVMEHFVADQLAKFGESPRDNLVERARVAFRKPCFTGESYNREARYFTSGDDVAGILCGALYKTESASAKQKPAVATQMFVRPRRAFSTGR